MKKFNLYIISITALIFCMLSCDDAFLDLAPKTQITVPAFFKSVADLELYVNGIENAMMPGGNYDDYASDNVTIMQGTEPYAGKLIGNLTVDNVSGWNDWGNLRTINLMLNNLGNIEGAVADINHLVGIARYFRAVFYISKVFEYSDVPWYDKVIESNEDDLLYKTQDPRATVVDKILEDLEYAASNIKEDMGIRTRISRFVALAELSRFCLFEGTYRKYHSEIGLSSDADRFLQRAVSASEAIIASGQFEITGAGTNVELAEGSGIQGSDGYRALFSSLRLEGNREMILWAEYQRTPLWRSHRADDLTAMSTNRYSLSRSLQESYLTKEGKPFSTVAGYATKEYSEVFVDRDPRMAETFAWPGMYEINPVNDAITYHVTVPGRGGYDQSKFFYKYKDLNAKQDDNTGQYTALPVYRYGEVLLNLAEAKAELKSLDAATISKTVNLLRKRVGMPDFNADAEVDDALKALYPTVSDNNILAIRRERRVELAGEGLRQKDIFRWGVGKLYEAAVSQEGIYVPALPYVYDVTGDDVPDRGIAATASQHTSDDVTWDDLDNPEVLFYLENGSYGYVRNKDDNKRKFEDPKHYYNPIPKSEIVLNPNLKQPYGW
jgi:hypothetical protein